MNLVQLQCVREGGFQLVSMYLVFYKAHFEEALKSWTPVGLWAKDTSAFFNSDGLKLIRALMNVSLFFPLVVSSVICNSVDMEWWKMFHLSCIWLFDHHKHGTAIQYRMLIVRLQYNVDLKLFRFTYGTTLSRYHIVHSCITGLEGRPNCYRFIHQVWILIYI